MDIRFLKIFRSPLVPLDISSLEVYDVLVELLL